MIGIVWNHQPRSRGLTEELPHNTQSPIYTTHFLPLRSVTGAIPAYFCFSAPLWKRSRCSPKAASNRGGDIGPAPGSVRNNGWSGSLTTSVAINRSRRLIVSGVTRSCSTRTSTFIGYTAKTAGILRHPGSGLDRTPTALITLGTRMLCAREKTSKAVVRAHLPPDTAHRQVSYVTDQTGLRRCARQSPAEGPNPA